MNTSFNDFIGVFEGAFSKEYCDDVIKRMDKAFELGYGYSRQSANDAEKHAKDDMQLYPSDVVSAEAVFTMDYTDHFNNVFWGECYKQYADEYSVLKDMDYHYSFGNKLQKTEVGQGYHLWHCEHGSKDQSRRLLAYIVYLNDVEEGGETEFLYQHKRVKPKQGTVVIFPAGFTHTHRGNPPLSNTKYIMTGWIEY